MATNQEQELMEVDPNTIYEKKAFANCRSKMSSLLRGTIQHIANLCFSAELISDDMYRDTFEGEWKPGQERTRHFIMCIYTRLVSLEKGGNVAQVEKDLRTLAFIVGNDSALAYIADAIRSCKTSLDFKRKEPNIALGITGPTLGPIANGAYAKGLITDEQHSVCTDPAATRDRMNTQRLLDVIESCVEYEPNDLRKFIKILKDEGKPISSIADDLEKELKELEQADHR